MQLEMQMVEFDSNITDFNAYDGSQNGGFRRGFKTFFEQDAQMGIPHDTINQLQQEGITIVDDLIHFDKDIIEQIAANLQRPAGRVPDPNPNAAPGATILMPSFGFGAKSKKKACDSYTTPPLLQRSRLGNYSGEHSMDYCHEEFCR